MAGTPRIKCFAPDGEYVASVKDFTLAGALMAALGDGATVRIGHAKRDTVYTEGVDGCSGESIDAVWSHVDLNWPRTVRKLQITTRTRGTHE